MSKPFNFDDWLKVEPEYVKAFEQFTAELDALILAQNARVGAIKGIPHDDGDGRLTRLTVESMIFVFAHAAFKLTDCGMVDASIDDVVEHAGKAFCDALETLAGEARLQ